MRTLLLTMILAGLAEAAVPPSVYAQGASSAPAAGPAGSEMTTYYVVLLRRGPKWTAEPTPEAKALSQGHMDNMDRLTKAGSLVLAGPFLAQAGDRALAGLFVLRADSAEHAKTLTESDPAVRGGRFVYEIVPWMGPKGLRY